MGKVEVEDSTWFRFEVRGDVRGEFWNHLQKSCPEDNKKANSLALRELYVPYHVHWKDKNVNIGHSVRKTMDKERDFGIPAGSTGRIPISGYRVALLFHLLTSQLACVRTCQMYRSRRERRRLTNMTTHAKITPHTVMNAMLAQIIRR
jgi:hypothetical protein